MALLIPTSVPNIQFQIVSMGTTPPITESIRVPKLLDLIILGTLPVIPNVFNQDNLNITAKYLAKTAIKEAQ